MNIDIDKAVEDLTWAILDNQVQKDGQPEVLKRQIRGLLEKCANHNELDEQMPEPMRCGSTARLAAPSVTAGTLS